MNLSSNFNNDENENISNKIGPKTPIIILLSSVYT